MKGDRRGLLLIGDNEGTPRGPLLLSSFDELLMTSMEPAAGDENTLCSGFPRLKTDGRPSWDTSKVSTSVSMADDDELVVAVEFVVASGVVVVELF